MSDRDRDREDIRKALDDIESSQSTVPHLPDGESMYEEDRAIVGWDPDSDGPDCYIQFEDGRLCRVDDFTDRWTGEVAGESYEDVMAPSEDEEDEETAE